MKRGYKLFIEDIYECIEKIEKFIGDMEYENFLTDDKTNSAVIMKLEIIGEATKNIPKEIRQKYKEVSWKEMAGMRDKIIHFYFGVDYELVWEVIKKRLPEIKPKIRQIIKDLENKGKE